MLFTNVIPSQERLYIATSMVRDFYNSREFRRLRVFLRSFGLNPTGKTTIVSAPGLRVELVLMVPALSPRLVTNDTTIVCCPAVAAPKLFSLRSYSLHLAGCSESRM